MSLLKTRQLQVGDNLKCGAGLDYSTATVEAIDSQFVELFRPYVHTGLKLECSERNSAILYVGIEKFKVYRDSDTLWEVYNR